MFFLGNASGHDFHFILRRGWTWPANGAKESSIRDGRNGPTGDSANRDSYFIRRHRGFGRGARIRAAVEDGAGSIHLARSGAFRNVDVEAGARMAAGQQAVAAVLIFAVNPYHLVIVYYRSDFAELLATALFPLLIWDAARGSRRIGRSAACPRWRSCLPASGFRTRPLR